MPVMPIVFYESAAFNGLAVINTAPDGIIGQSGTHHFKLPAGLRLSGLIARGANSNEVQLWGSWDKMPLLESLQLPALAADFKVEDVVPLHILAPESGTGLLSCFYDNVNNAEVSGVVVLIGGKYWIGGPDPDVPIRIVQASSTTAGVAGTWTPITLTWSTDLPGGGPMTVYGMRCKSASSYAARLVHTLPSGLRPGVPTQHALQGPMVWFEEPFVLDMANLPNGEINSSTTTNSHQFELAVSYPKE